MRILAVCVVLLLLAGCGGGGGSLSQPDERSIIQGRLNALGAAVEAESIVAVMAFFSLDYYDEGRNYEQLCAVYALLLNPDDTIVLDFTFAVTDVFLWWDGGYQYADVSGAGEIAVVNTETGDAQAIVLVGEVMRKEQGAWVCYGDQS